jgi:hypothetical protein
MKIALFLQARVAPALLVPALIEAPRPESHPCRVCSRLQQSACCLTGREPGLAPGPGPTLPQRRARRRRQLRLRVRFSQDRERILPQRPRPVEAALSMLLLIPKEGNHRHLRRRRFRPLGLGASRHTPQAARTRVEIPGLTGAERVPALAPILAKGDCTHKSRRQDTGPGQGRGWGTVERRRTELRRSLARIAGAQAGVRRQVCKLTRANSTHWDR